MGKHPIIILLACVFTGSCKTVYRPDRDTVTANRQKVMPAERTTQKQLTGIDFMATGTEPLPWTLEIDLEKGFFFTPSSGRLLIAAPVAGLVSGEEIIYEADTDSGKITIRLSNKACNTILLKQNGTGVSIKLRATEYTGCGGYLYDFQLNDAWLLESVDGKPLGAEAGKHPPIFEVDLVANKIQGFDGCRRFSGTLTVQGNHIRFSDFIFTGRNCAGNIASKLFADQLSGKLVDYSVKEGKLHIYLADDSKLIFSKY